MLKGRLDGLRKAKNTTIFRREREEIKVSSPNLGKLRTKSPSHLDVLTLSQQCGCCHGDLQEQIRDLNSQVDKLNASLLSERAKCKQLSAEMAVEHKNEMTTLKAHHDEIVHNLTAQFKKVERPSSHLQELQCLRAENAELSHHLEEVLTSNEALRKGSTLLQEKSEALLEELSIKEAEWSQKEDRLKEEIRRQWGERYHEWITKAEKKMDELHQVNNLLQAMLKTKEQNNL